MQLQRQLHRLHIDDRDTKLVIIIAGDDDSVLYRVFAFLEKNALFVRVPEVPQGGLEAVRSNCQGEPCNKNG